MRGSHDRTTRNDEAGQTETLRQWLDTRPPITVVDVRRDDDRAQWAIPGSVHVKACEGWRVVSQAPSRTSISHAIALWWCNAGRVSQTAAAVLTERGGMKAWSLAWNTAPVPLTDPSVRVIHVRRTGKGCL